MTGIKKIVSVAGAQLFGGSPSVELADVGPREQELIQLLTVRNGFYAFDGALHVRSSGGGDLSLETWNSASLWRDAYEGMAGQGLFFAEDVFGNQFAIVKERIASFDSETGALQIVSESIEEWCELVLADPEFLTGSTFARAWQQVAKRPIGHGQRLVAKTPFVLGGDYHLHNLYEADAVKAMRWHGNLAVQLRDVPDGGSVTLAVKR